MPRQITVFTSNGVGAPVTVEHESERQARRVIKAARNLLNSNRLWPPSEYSTHIDWLFNVAKAVDLNDEIDKLERLL